MADPSGLLPLQLLVGLGNPGEKYAGTRHNVGFMALERLAGRGGVSFRHQAKLHGLLAEVGQGHQRLRLLMPQTYMNDSGRSIRAALDWYGIEPVQMLVLVDDMDLPLGRAAPFPTLAARSFPACASASARPPSTRWNASSAPWGTCWVASRQRSSRCWRRCSMKCWRGSI
jgi:hypothetical protein